MSCRHSYEEFNSKLVIQRTNFIFEHEKSTEVWPHSWLRACALFSALYKTYLISFDLSQTFLISLWTTLHSKSAISHNQWQTFSGPLFLRWLSTRDILEDWQALSVSDNRRPCQWRPNQPPYFHTPSIKWFSRYSDCSLHVEATPHAKLAMIAESLFACLNKYTWDKGQCLLFFVSSIRYALSCLLWQSSLWYL